MAAPFDLLDNVTLTSASVTGGVIYTSPTQNNDSGTTFNSLKCIVDYTDIQGIDNSSSLTAIIEGKANGSDNWYPLGYQFQQIGVGSEGKIREIIIQPSMLWMDAGVDNILWVQGSGVIAQISNQQATLAASWRVKILISDPNNTFTSTTISLYGERYDG